MIVVRKIIFVVNVDKVQMHRLSKTRISIEKYSENSNDFRRPVPAVEEEREQAEFETDIKFLRERQRRMLIEIFYFQNKNSSLFFIQVNFID
jgi:hypothetical protein